MAKISNNFVHTHNLLGYKELSRDGYLVLTDGQGHTTGYADMVSLDYSMVDYYSDKVQYDIRDFKIFLDTCPLDFSIITIPSHYNFCEQKAYWNVLGSRAYHYQHKFADLKISNQEKTKNHIASRNINDYKICAMNMTHFQHILVLFGKTKTEIKQFEFKIKHHMKSFASHLHALTSIQKNNLIFQIAPSFKNEIKHTFGVKRIPLKYSFHYNYIQYKNLPHLSTYIAFADMDHINSSNFLNNLWARNPMERYSVIGILSVQSHLNSQAQNSSADPDTPFKYRSESLHLIVKAHSFINLANRLRTIKLLSHEADLNQHGCAFNIIKGKKAEKVNLRAIFQPVSEQSTNPDNNAKFITTDVLAKALPIDYDLQPSENGSYLGYTVPNNPLDECSPVSSNTLQEDQCPTHLTLISGRPGMGKTTLAKQLETNAFAKGYHVINFDIGSEYERLTHNQFGKYVYVPNVDNSINFLQFFPVNITKQDEKYNSKEFKQCIDDNFNRIISQFSLLDSNLTDRQADLLSNYLKAYYKKIGYDNVIAWHYHVKHNPSLNELVKFIKSKYTIPNRHVIKLIQKLQLHLWDYTHPIPVHDFQNSVVTFHINNEAIPQLRTGKILQVNFLNALFYLAPDIIHNVKYNHTHYYLNINEANVYLTYYKNTGTMETLYHLLHTLMNFGVYITLDVSLDDVLQNMKHVFQIAPRKRGLMSYADNMYQISLIALIKQVTTFHLFGETKSDMKWLYDILKDEDSQIEIKSKDLRDILYNTANLKPHQLLTISPLHWLRWCTELTREQLKNF